jgi:hypothetical protein
LTDTTALGPWHRRCRGRARASSGWLSARPVELSPATHLTSAGTDAAPGRWSQLTPCNNDLSP